MATEVKKQEAKAPAKMYDLATLVKSQKYAAYKALIPVILNDGKLYSEEDVDKALKSELKRPVKHDIN